ncbi:MAG: hypothetical protein QNJ72_44185 [Pleurocapsa sp. MO_226.B13]|nr:hypothetical protein [Pleurocapsa sp. MO_226.B13]
MAESRVNQKIKIETIEAVSELLDQLEPKLKSQSKPEPHQDVKLLNLRHKIERILRLGYSYEEVVEVLKQQNINISTERLKRYLKDADD